MYAIGNIIYGLPLHDPIGSDDVEYSDELEEAIEWEQEGFQRFYSGNGSQSPTAFGVMLDEFNECSTHIDVSKLKLEPSPFVLKEYNELWNNLTDELKTELTEKFGSPRTFILWSTS